MPELTITSNWFTLQSWLQNIYHGLPYARVDFILQTLDLASDPEFGWELLGILGAQTLSYVANIFCHSIHETLEQSSAEKSWCKKTEPNAHCTVKSIKFNRCDFQMRKYMSDVDSTHCTPLPRDHFLLPWDPATELAFETIESDSSKL